MVTLLINRYTRLFIMQIPNISQMLKKWVKEIKFNSKNFLLPFPISCCPFFQLLWSHFSLIWSLLWNRFILFFTSFSKPQPLITHNFLRFHRAIFLILLLPQRFLCFPSFPAFQASSLQLVQRLFHSSETLETPLLLISQKFPSTPLTSLLSRVLQFFFYFQLFFHFRLLRKINSNLAIKLTHYRMFRKKKRKKHYKFLLLIFYSDFSIIFSSFIVTNRRL